MTKARNGYHAHSEIGRHNLKNNNHNASRRHFPEKQKEIDNNNNRYRYCNL